MKFDSLITCYGTGTKFVNKYNKLMPVQIHIVEIVGNHVIYLDKHSNNIGEDMGEEVFAVYDSVDDFKNGQLSSYKARPNKATIAYSSYKEEINISYREDDTVIANGWCVNSDGTLCNVDREVVKLQLIGDNWFAHIDDEVTLYPSREMCLAYNHVEHIDDNGETNIIGGELADIALTEKQKDVVRKLERVLEECRDANVFIMVDNDSDDVYAYNANKYRYVYDGDNLNGWGYDIMKAMQKLDENIITVEGVCHECYGLNKQ